MSIEQDQIVGIKYTASVDNEIVDNNMDHDAPLFFMFGRGQMMPGLESRIKDMNVGDSSELEIPADEAYGAHNPEAIQTVPKEHLEHIELHEGLVLQGQGENGEPVMVMVKEINDNSVIMDHNHPLAGQNINFSLTIEAIRDPNDDELQTGLAAENQHDHGEGGGCCGGGDKTEHQHDHGEGGGCGSGSGSGNKGGCGCH